MWVFNVLTTTTRCRWRTINCGVKTAAWRTFRRRSTLHHAVKNERVTAQGPVTKPQMDCMSHRGAARRQLPPLPLLLPPLRSLPPPTFFHCPRHPKAPNAPKAEQSTQRQGDGFLVLRATTLSTSTDASSFARLVFGVPARPPSAQAIGARNGHQRPAQRRAAGAHGPPLLQ